MLTNVLIILGGCIGAIGTFQLQKFGWNPVTASCLIGLFGVLMAQWINQDDLAMIIFAGSFVGMTASSLATLPLILVAGLFCGGLYLILMPYFDGFGGKLGALAFISVLIVISMRKFSAII